MWRSYFTERKWLLWSWGGFAFIILSLLAQTYIDVKINEWYKGFYDLLQKAPERELSEFYDGIALFMKLAIPYVIIYTITNYFTRLWAFRWREAMTFSYMPYWRAVDAKVEAAFRKELVYGEDDRKNYAQAPSILQLFTGIKFNYHRLFLHYGYFDLWIIMYNQTMIIVPYLLMGPGLFTGAMTLGVLIQTSSAFREVQGSFSLFLQNWTRITELRSIHKRLMEFEEAINFKNKLRKPRKSDVRA